MTITIFSDASHAHVKPVGSYAYWIEGPYGAVKESGAFTSPCQNATEAEIKAIANALAACLAAGWDDVQSIVVNCDSLPAMHLIQKGGKNKSPGAHYGALYCNYLIHGLQLKYGIPGISFRHIKAHSGRGDPRSLRNNWCDKEAKKELNKALSQLRA